MTTHEEIEKVRQEIMRMRELLTLLRGHLEAGEQSYERLFARHLPPDAMALKEKDRQWRLAEHLVADLAPLERAVATCTFRLRMMHQGFEELHEIVLATPKPS
jgi:hypothetical protein